MVTYIRKHFNSSSTSAHSFLSLVLVRVMQGGAAAVLFGPQCSSRQTLLREDVHQSHSIHHPSSIVSHYPFSEKYSNERSMSILHDRKGVAERPVTLFQLQNACCGSGDSAFRGTGELELKEARWLNNLRKNRRGECTVCMKEDSQVNLSRVWCCGKVLWWVELPSAFSKSSSGITEATKRIIRSDRYRVFLAILGDHTGAVGVIHVASIENLEGERDESEELREMLEENTYISFRGRLVLTEGEDEWLRLFDFNLFPEITHFFPISRGLRSGSQQTLTNENRGTSSLTKGLPQPIHVDGAAPTGDIWFPGGGEPISAASLPKLWDALGVVSCSAGAAFSLPAERSNYSQKKDNDCLPSLLNPLTSSKIVESSEILNNKPESSMHRSPLRSSLDFPLYCLKGKMERLPGSNVLLYHQLSIIHMHQYLRKRASKFQFS